MKTATSARIVGSGCLVAVSLALLARGLAYFAGSGPRDGEDIPAFSVLAASSVALFGTILLRWDGRPGRRRRWVVTLLVAGGLPVVASGWLVLNVLLERWAS